MNITLFETGSDGDNISNTILYFKNTRPLPLWKQFGLFDEDFIEAINIHWLKFLPPHNTSNYVLAVLYIVMMTIGCGGNAFVIFMLLRCRNLRTPANILIMNLAISDFGMMVKTPVFIFNSFYLGPALGQIGCDIYGFLGGLTGTVSICTLAAISFDRYYVIKFPLNMRFTELRAKICVAVTWCYGAVFSSIPLLNQKISYVPEGYLTSCSFDYLSQHVEVKTFILIFFTAAWVVPFSMITFCYINILKTVLKTRNVNKENTESSRHMKVEEKRRQELKLALTILLITSLWFASWTPYAVVALLGISNRADLIQPLASMIPALFCKMAACVDPFVYAVTNQKFKGEIIKLFTRNETTKRIGSSRVWTTQSTFEKTGSTKQKMYYMHSCQASEDVEEEMVPIGNVEKIQGKKFHPSEPSASKQQDRIETQSDTEMTTTAAGNDGNAKPIWWYRPSFSNRHSSIRGMARNLKKTKSLDCDYCDESSKTAM